MVRRLEDIEARIAELERIREAEDARTIRLLQAAAGFYEKRGDVGLGPFRPLFDKLKLGPRDLDEYFKMQEEEARRYIAEVTPLLQLTKAEMALIERQERAILLIDPCSWVHNSPGWECQHLAAQCGSSPYQSAGASVTFACACATDNNTLDPRVEAIGQGGSGMSMAYLHAYSYFDIPARPQTANVDVYTLVHLHGFYSVRTATGRAHVGMDIEMAAFQYGQQWASVTSNVINTSSDVLQRVDTTRSLHFMIPTGADPFQVRVSVKLTAWVKQGGALALVDFASLAGNYIKVPWVNTYSP